MRDFLSLQFSLETVTTLRPAQGSQLTLGAFITGSASPALQASSAPQMRDRSHRDGESEALWVSPFIGGCSLHRTSLLS